MTTGRMLMSKPGCTMGDLNERLTAADPIIRAYRYYCERVSCLQLQETLDFIEDTRIELKNFELKVG